MQVPGEVVDPELTALPIGHARDVLVHRLARVNPLLDAVQAGGELHGEREIRIRRRVGHTVFASGRVAALRRYPNKRRYVLRGPRHVHGGLVTRDEPFVGIHQRIGHGAVAAGVPQQPPDVPPPHLRQLDRPLRVEESVLPLGEQRLVRVHPRAVATEDRFGHEGGDEAVSDRDGPHHEPQRGQVVGHRQRISGAKVDFVLATGHFVMRRLRTQLHLLEARYDDAARPLPAVHRDEIEVAAGVQRPGRRLAAVALLEDEKLHLAPDAHRKAQLAGPLDLPLQGGPGAPLERPAVRVADVADEPRHGSSGLSVARLAGRALPGKHAEAREIGYQQGVRLLHPGEPLERRAVEQHLAGQGLLEPGSRHLHCLVHAQQVGELQQQKAHAAFLQLVEQLAGFGGGRGHGNPR